MPDILILCESGQYSVKALNYASQMTPYEKRFQTLKQEYRTVTKQIKESDNDADITWLNEHRDDTVVEARELIKKPN